MPPRRLPARGWCISSGSLLLAAMFYGLCAALATTPAPDWQVLAPGMDLKYVMVGKPGSSANSRITILRINPNLWQLELVGSSQTRDSAGHSVREWCRKEKFTAAINAGMFATDQSTHIGYMRSGKDVNNGKRNSYQSVAAFGPREKSLPAFRIFDLDAPDVSFDTILKDYGSVVQNLRLIKRPGLNQWQQQDKKWSEAALGEDAQGRVLFIFCRLPFSMYELNQELLAAGIGIVAAQHLEGGPEAQLYFHVGGEEKEMFGSYETSLEKDDTDAISWPIPNALAVRPRPAPAP